MEHCNWLVLHGSKVLALHPGLMSHAAAQLRLFLQRHHFDLFDRCLLCSSQYYPRGPLKVLGSRHPGVQLCQLRAQAALQGVLTPGVPQAQGLDPHLHPHLGPQVRLNPLQVHPTKQAHLGL